MRILSCLLQASLAPLARRFGEQDERALAQGWTVTAGRFGSRTYRDPRWDHVEELRIAHLRPGSGAEELNAGTRNGTSVRACTPVLPSIPAPRPQGPRDARVLGRPAVTR